MRVVYDYGIRNAAAPLNPNDAGKTTEPVLVVSLVENGRGAAAAGVGGSAGSDDEVRISEEALARSREVEAHEKSHLALLGGVAASPILYGTVRGPDGEAIKVGGSVKVDMAEVPGDPEATLRKARTIIAAADAPHNPSAADARTAAKAYRMASQAQEEIAQRQGSGLNTMA